LTLEKSTSPPWWSSAKYMVGTPAKSVTRSRFTIAAASSGVKRGSSVKQPPTASVAFWMQVWPKEWKSGSVASATSSRPTGASFGTTIAQLISRLAWVSSAPLGFPVVPEV
jgi:hypothetical protein